MTRNSTVSEDRWRLALRSVCGNSEESIQNLIWCTKTLDGVHIQEFGLQINSDIVVWFTDVKAVILTTVTGTNSLFYESKAESLLASFTSKLHNAFGKIHYSCDRTSYMEILKANLTDAYYIKRTPFKGAGRLNQCLNADIRCTMVRNDVISLTLHHQKTQEEQLLLIMCEEVLIECLALETCSCVEILKRRLPLLSEL